MDFNLMYDITCSRTVLASSVQRSSSRQYNSDSLFSPTWWVSICMSACYDDCPGGIQAAFQFSRLPLRRPYHTFLLRLPGASPRYICGSENMSMRTHRAERSSKLTRFPPSSPRSIALQNVSDVGVCVRVSTRETHLAEDVICQALCMALSGRTTRRTREFTEWHLDFVCDAFNSH